MKFLLVFCLALSAVQAFQECSGALDLDADKLVGLWHEYERSLVTLSKGKCVSNDISKINDTTLKIVHKQFVNDKWETVEWICPIDGKTLHVTDGKKEIATMNVLGVDDDFIILETCTLLDLPAAMIITTNSKEAPSGKLLKKINGVLDAQRNIKPFVFHVKQDCE